MEGMRVLRYGLQLCSLVNGDESPEVEEFIVGSLPTIWV
jgi:hypothetical protein